MGMPSTLADIEDKAADNRFMAGAFANGSAGAAGIGRPYRKPPPPIYVMSASSRAEARARAVEEHTRRLVDNTLAWVEATVGVVPLRKRR
jgi:hypothetical protein